MANHSQSSSTIVHIHKLFNEQQQASALTQYNAGLKAMLDLMPENSEHLPDETIDAYLWVVEVLLMGVDQLLSEQAITRNTFG